MERVQSASRALAKDRLCMNFIGQIVPSFVGRLAYARGSHPTLPKLARRIDTMAIGRIGAALSRG